MLDLHFPSNKEEFKMKGWRVRKSKIENENEKTNK